MRIAIRLWVAQVLLAALFAMAGWMKATTPIQELAAKIGWVSAVSPGLVRFIGWSELAAAAGLILPALTRILPKLTALAALGILLIMIFAAGFHVQRGEWNALPITLVIGATAAFVAWGRWKRAPIPPRA
jgi:uncharacterized membrane protein YphA (DoxX/SURF4 family)